MKSWWTQVTSWRVVRHLPNLGEAGRFLGIFLFAVAVPVLLRLKLPRLASLLEPKRPPSPPARAEVHTIVRAVDAVLRVGKPLVRPGCLTRGVTLYYFLRRVGLEITLCFGLGHHGGAFVGHCWLVKDGEPFLEATDPRPLFTAVYRIPTRSPSPTPHDQRLSDGRSTDARPSLH
jgi:hypothetical protein